MAFKPAGMIYDDIFAQIEKDTKMSRACCCSFNGTYKGNLPGCYLNQIRCCQEFAFTCCTEGFCPDDKPCCGGYAKQFCCVRHRGMHCKLACFNKFFIGEPPEPEGPADAFLKETFWLSYCCCYGSGFAGIHPYCAGKGWCMCQEYQSRTVAFQCLKSRGVFRPYPCCCYKEVAMTDCDNFPFGVGCCGIYCVQPAEAREQAEDYIKLTSEQAAPEQEDMSMSMRKVAAMPAPAQAVM